MSGSEDVYDIEDLRSIGTWFGERFGAGSAALGVALAVVAVCLAFALVLHVYGAVGGSPVDANQGPSPASGSAGDAQQRFQNYITFISFTFAPLFLPLLAVGVAFAGVFRARGTRRKRIAAVTMGAATGMAIGYAVYVTVAHLAYGEAEEGFYVESLPVNLHVEVIVTNALALAVVVAVGSAIAGYAGTLLDGDAPPGTSVSSASPGVEVDGTVTADGAADATGDRGEPPAAESGGAGVDAADDRGGSRADDRDGARTDGRAGTAADARSGTAADGRDGIAGGARGGTSGEDRHDDAADDRDGGPGGDSSTPSRVGDTGPASDYQDQGPTRGRTPHYDPDDRDWNGHIEDDPGEDGPGENGPGEDRHDEDGDEDR